MQIRGSCHCGNIEFVYELAGEVREIPVRACSCSFCRKHAGAWTSTRGGTLAVSIRDPAQMANYQFGTRTADFLVCKICGVVPLVSSRIDERTYAVVNANTFENIEPAMLKPTAASFDGEGVGARLERRQRNWIPDVVFAPPISSHHG